MQKKGIILAVVFLIFFFISADAQCSQCKLLAEQSGSTSEDAIFGSDGGNNINSAILYIMAIPYIILFFLFRKRILRFFKEMKTEGKRKAINN